MFGLLGRLTYDPHKTRLIAVVSYDGGHFTDTVDLTNCDKFIRDSSILIKEYCSSVLNLCQEQKDIITLITILETTSEWSLRFWNIADHPHYEPPARVARSFSYETIKPTTKKPSRRK